MREFLILLLTAHHVLGQIGPTTVDTTTQMNFIVTTPALNDPGTNAIIGNKFASSMNNSQPLSTDQMADQIKSQQLLIDDLQTSLKSTNFMLEFLQRTQNDCSWCRTRCCPDERTPQCTNKADVHINACDLVHVPDSSDVEITTECPHQKKQSKTENNLQDTIATDQQQIKIPNTCSSPQQVSNTQTIAKLLHVSDSSSGSNMATEGPSYEDFGLKESIISYEKILRDLQRENKRRQVRRRKYNPTRKYQNRRKNKDCRKKLDF